MGLYLINTACGGSGSNSTNADNELNFAKFASTSDCNAEACDVVVSSLTCTTVPESCSSQIFINSNVLPAAQAIIVDINAVSSGTGGSPTLSITTDLPGEIICADLTGSLRCLWRNNHSFNNISISNIPVFNVEQKNLKPNAAERAVFEISLLVDGGELARSAFTTKMLKY